MPEVLLKLIEQLNSSVIVLLLLLVAVGWVLVKVGRWSEKFSTHDGEMKKLGDMRDTVIKLETKVDLIYKNTLQTKLVQQNSPISLTQVGKDISEKIKAENILNRNIAKLTGAVEAKSPKNAYDIQMASMRVAKETMLSLLNEEELNLTKQEAFQRGLLVEDVADIFGVLLRNYILAQKGLPIADVDAHEPKSGNA